MSRNAKGEGSLHKTPKGWRGYVTVNGKRKYFRAKTKAEAASRKRDLLNQRDTTGIVAGRTPTLGAWLEHWLKIVTGVREMKTIETYGYVINSWIPARFKETQLNRITVEHLETLYKDLSESGLSGASVLKVHHTLTGALTVAQQRGHVAFNPAAMVINKPKANPTKVETLSEADIEMIERVLETVRLRARWRLALGLGLRPGEALGLEWHHIDFTNRTITIEQQIQRVQGELRIIPRTKTGQPRIVPLPEYLAAELQEWRKQQLIELGTGEGYEQWSPDGKPHAWVFTSQTKLGHPVSPDGDRTQWRRILDRAGLPYVKPYVTRHTAASILISHNVDVATVAEILGHSVRTAQNFYIHAVQERVTAVADLLDQVHNRVPDRVPLDFEADGTKK